MTWIVSLKLAKTVERKCSHQNRIRCEGMSLLSGGRSPFQRAHTSDRCGLHSAHSLVCQSRPVGQERAGPSVEQWYLSLPDAQSLSRMDAWRTSMGGQALGGLTCCPLASHTNQLPWRPARWLQAPCEAAIERKKPNQAEWALVEHKSTCYTGWTNQS